MEEEEENKKKVLVITYYWPPSGGSGVQRWLKFVKYLPQFGWQPYVFTPENPSFHIQDESLLKDIPPEAEVLHFPIWEPYGLYKKVTQAKSVELSSNSVPVTDSLLKKISVWLRGNIFLPDPRVFWVHPSVKFLHDFINENKIRTIITTGPPHSVHLIGLKLKKHNPHVRWLADFRDPWSEWGFLDTVKTGSLARTIHKHFEKKVLANASLVTSITPFYVRHFERLGNRKVHLLTNGYDEDDFKDLVLKRPAKFIIRHVGVVNEKCNPIPFLEAAATLCQADIKFRENVQIDFVGEVNSTFRTFVLNHTLLNSIITFTPSVPHAEVIKLYGESALLLLILTGYKDAEGYMPGKLFEYLATGLPVLGVGPVQGDAAKLLHDTGAGEMVAAEAEKIITHILAHFASWKENSKVEKRNWQGAYSRKSTTQKLVALLE